MKILLAMIFGVSILACDDEKVIKNIDLKVVTIDYNNPPGLHFNRVDYLFDLENSICYTAIGHALLAPADFNTCYTIYMKYIEPNELPVEKE